MRAVIADGHGRHAHHPATCTNACAVQQGWERGAKEALAHETGSVGHYYQTPADGGRHMTSLQQVAGSRGGEKQKLALLDEMSAAELDATCRNRPQARRENDGTRLKTTIGA
eukprot:4457110-Pleurochrysis_carterae.AAC.1